MAITFASPTESGQRTPAGEYIMRLKDIEEAEPSAFNPGTQRLKFIFTIQEVVAVTAYPDDIDEDDPDALDAFDATLVGNDHWEWTNNKMGGNATLRQWLTGMLGRTIEKNDNLDPAQFIGKDYKVELGMKGYVIQQTGESGTKFTILTIKPHKVRPTRTRNNNRQVGLESSEKPAPWETDDAEGFDE